MVCIPVGGKNHLSTLIPADIHKRVLADSVDVPEERPSFPLPLKKVGISGKTVWVRLAGNNGGRLPFKATIHLNLDGNRRGIHMSRIEQGITALHGRKFNSLPEYGIELARLILSSQSGSRVSLDLAGQMPLVQKAPVSGLESVDTIEVSCKLVVEREQGRETVTTGAGAAVHHMTACPCTLSYNETLASRFQYPWSRATHSQRSQTQLRVTPPANLQPPSFGELIAVLDSVLHVSRDLLKRPDETELVLKAHRFPQFSEDSVREVARAAGRTFGATLPQETRIQVFSRSLESIHIHDVECSLDTSLGEILTVRQSIEEV
jgi:GTP cyclohydrolase FolE2